MTKIKGRFVRIAVIRTTVSLTKLYKSVLPKAGLHSDLETQPVPCILETSFGTGPRPNTVALTKWGNAMRLLATSVLVGFWACTAHGQDDVLRQAEEALAELGYQPGEIDGVWDETLAKAVDGYKRDRGLDPNGDLSLREFSALRSEASAAAQAANATIVRPYVPDVGAPDVPEVVRTEERVPYHRIEDCRFRHGIGTMFYSEGRREEFHLTDICFDAEGGRFWSAETVNGWSLTNDAPSFKEFKVIEEGVPDWQRHTLMLQPLPEMMAQMGLTLPGNGGSGANWFWQVPRSYQAQAGLSRLNMGTGVFLDDPQDVESCNSTRVSESERSLKSASPPKARSSDARIPATASPRPVRNSSKLSPGVAARSSLAC